MPNTQLKILTLARQGWAVTKKYPVLRGMITYAALWPTSNIVQQSIHKHSQGQSLQNYDWVQAGRFTLYGSLWVAPTLYVWVKIVGRMIPGQSFKIAVQKAAFDQIFYAPFAISSFYLGLSFLEDRPFRDAVQELKQKFVPTWKAGVCVWPIVQTINFAFIKERNRVPFLGTISFFWTVFLSYMKSLQLSSTPVSLQSHHAPTKIR